MDSNLLTTPEASQVSGLGRNQLARLCNMGRLECVRRGRDWFISLESLRRYMAELHPDIPLKEPGEGTSSENTHS